MKFTLRDYQQQFCRAVVNAFTLGAEGQGPFERVLGVAATGAGKTIMAAALVWWITRKPRRTGRVLMLADTDELVQQAADKILQATGLIPDIEKAASMASHDSAVVVGSIQTLSRRLERWPADHFDLVIADEAHLSMAANWQKTLKHFGDGGAWVLGITATPERGDGQKLMRYYEHIAAEIGLFDLINRGHLAPITVQVCPLQIDCTKLVAAKKGLNKGEFDGDQLEEAIEPYLAAIIDEWQTHAGDRRTLVFHPSVKASQKFTEMLQARGIAAAHVSGASKDRKEVLKGFESGRFQVLNNAQLLTKGYDCPAISCVINLRPTKSRTQYLQMVGRGTRTCEGKTDCLLLDFLWQFQELGIMRPAALVAKGDEHEDAVAAVMERGKRLSLGEASEEAEREREQQIIRQLKRAAERGGRQTYDARVLGAMLHQPDLIDYEPRAKWERLPPTRGQQRFLETQGIDPKSVKGLGHAAKIMHALADRRNHGMATPKQVAALAVAEVPDAHQLTFSDALSWLDKLIAETPDEGMEAPAKAYAGPAVVRGVRIDD